MRRWVLLLAIGLWSCPVAVAAQERQDPPPHGIHEKKQDRRKPAQKEKTAESRQGERDSTDTKAGEDGRRIRDDRTERDPRREPPPPQEDPDETTRPKPVLRDEFLTPGGPTFFLTEPPEPPIVLRCRDALVCPLNPRDDYLAWMLVRQTTIPYRGIAETLADVGSWEEAAKELSISDEEFYAALGQSPPREDDPLKPRFIESAVEHHLAGVRLPRFACDYPVVLKVDPELQRRWDLHPTDEIDDIVADRIADETGWCHDELIRAREALGTWGRVARKLSISPFLFEASFGLELRIDRVGRDRVARYPRDADIRDVAERGAWPELVGR
jgi:hypothetical protein